jgi:hypothetical protein
LKPILESAALVLAIVNGLFLLKFYVRDRSRLVVTPVHPDWYLWWFRMPDVEVKGKTVRTYGFLLYVGVGNRGLRHAAVVARRLFIRLNSGKRQELKSISMPELEIKMSHGVKSLPTFGQRTASFAGETMVESGGSIAGTLLYTYGCWGDESWNPLLHDGKVKAQLVVTDVFGRKASCKVLLTEKKWSEIVDMAPALADLNVHQ